MCNYRPIINGVIKSPHLRLKDLLCLCPTRPPHHRWFRGFAALWGLFRSPEVLLAVTPRFSPEARFLAVSHLQEGLLSCQRATLHSSVTLRSVKITPFCLFCWPAEDGVHMQVWPGAADGHRELGWMENPKPGGESWAERWWKQGLWTFKRKPIKLSTILLWISEDRKHFERANLLLPAGTRGHTFLSLCPPQTFYNLLKMLQSTRQIGPKNILYLSVTYLVLLSIVDQ